MEIVRPGDRKERFLRIGVMGEPKTGKTRFATAIPWGEFFGEQAIYVAWDPGADDVEASSILPEDRERMIVVKPSPKTKKVKVPGETEMQEILVLDPHQEAVSIASRQWRKDFPDAKVLIWDTMTATARDILYAFTDSGVFVGEKGDKHISVGEVNTPYYIANPMEGDYGIAQRDIFHILGFLFKQPMHIIVLFHIQNVDTDAGTTIAFGPGTIGKATVRTVASVFDNLFRTDMIEKLTNTKPPSREPHYVLHTQRKGLYLGGIRTGHGKNPIPEVSLDDPRAAWGKIVSVLKGESK